MSAQGNFYTAKKGDTLWQIAKTNGATAEELRKINGLKSADRIAVGQRIALRKEAVCGVEALFLDRDRNPIKGLNFRIERCGKAHDGTTGENGKSKRLFTETPDDEVKIWAKRLDGSWKLVTTVVSGFGNKLVTLISGHIVVEAKTEKHPELPHGTKPDPKERPKPKYGPGNAPPPTTDKKELGLKTTSTKTPDGKALTVVEGDIPGLDEFLDPFNGELMGDADYAWAAKELGVEEAAIRAYAKVESGGTENSGFIKLGKRMVPKILYERHYFSTLTKHQYSAKYPDISLPTGYYVAGTKYVVADDEYKKNHHVPTDVQYFRAVGKKDSQKIKDSSLNLKDMLEGGQVTELKDKYLDGTPNYKRLSKAYQLEKTAALESCSWGAFQIMGSNWKQMGYASGIEFAKAMSRSEKEQIKAFVLFIKKVKPAIVKALKDKDWDNAAKLYNGQNYKQNHYDTKLEAAYKKFKG